MIIGGCQSAVEWAALLADSDVEAVHVVYRHDTPEFTASDWHFADGMMDLTATVPGWFRHLPPEEREAVAKRFWAEGRLKLEPWLTPAWSSPPSTAGPANGWWRAGRRQAGRSKQSSRTERASWSTTSSWRPATNPT